MVEIRKGASKAFKEKIIEEGPWKNKGDANNMWEKMATCIRKVASEVLGVTKGSGCESAIKPKLWVLVIMTTQLEN